MLTQEVLGDDGPTADVAADPNAVLWELPEFSDEQMAVAKWKYRYRWVGAGTSSTGVSNDEQEAVDAYQKAVDDPNVCSCEYYVDGALASYFLGRGKPACPEPAVGVTLPVAATPSPDPSFYYSLPWCQRHSRALWIGGGVLVVGATVTTVLVLRRRRRKK